MNEKFRQGMQNFARRYRFSSIISFSIPNLQSEIRNSLDFPPETLYKHLDRMENSEFPAPKGFLMGQENSYPRMRSLDIFPAEVSGQKVVCLRDPLNLSGKLLFIPFPTFFIISHFDGLHSIVDIQSEFMRRFGELLYREKIQDLIDQLDEYLLLESERFRLTEQKIIEDFRSSPLRPLTLSGESYEEDGEKLRKSIEFFFRDPEGPGFPAPQGKPQNLAGVIAPHIDYRRGGTCYAFAHRAILEASPPDLFILLGTAHSAMKQPFALTRKHFQTPWGPVETDAEFLSAMETGCGGDFYEDELAHRMEHSIELQLVFLRALWPGKTPFQMVPILCGSFQEAILKGTSPMDLPGVAPFIAALKKAATQTGKKVCLLASADLAHVGLRFGDPDPPNRLSLRSLAEEDRRLLEYAERNDAEGFFTLLAREKDRRKVCGLSPIYVLLRLLEGVSGKLLKYSQSVDSNTQSVVTFASLAFYA
jgi:AmmeMemoRadiSam system protein B